jgi:hypothetical protein
MNNNAKSKPWLVPSSLPEKLLTPEEYLVLPLMNLQYHRNRKKAPEIT